MHPSCGCHEEPTVFAVVRRGEGASPTPLNFWTQIIVLIEDEPKSKLLIANLDPDEWDPPPKPKWMRWNTYNRYLERHDAYEAYGIAELMAKFFSK